MEALEAQEIVALLKAAFPRQELTAETVKVYAHMLADLDGNETRAAVEELVRTERFFPTVSEIRGRVAKRAVGAPSPMEAWELAAAGGVPVHPLVRRAKEIIGRDWAIRTCENLPVLIGTFNRVYTDLVANAERREVTVEELPAIEGEWTDDEIEANKAKVAQLAGPVGEGIPS